jgi:hypothetical protein
MHPPTPESPVHYRVSNNEAIARLYVKQNLPRQSKLTATEQRENVAKANEVSETYYEIYMTWPSVHGMLNRYKGPLNRLQSL